MYVVRYLTYLYLVPSIDFDFFLAAISLGIWISFLKLMFGGDAQVRGIKYTT